MWKLEGGIAGLGSDAYDAVNISLPPIPSVVVLYIMEKLYTWYIVSVSFVFNL